MRMRTLTPIIHGWGLIIMIHVEFEWNDSKVRKRVRNTGMVLVQQEQGMPVIQGYRLTHMALSDLAVHWVFLDSAHPDAPGVHSFLLF